MRRPHPTRVFALCLLLAALGLAAPAPVGADDDPGASTRDLFAARLLEAAEVRMKAKVEEARLLEAAGRRDEALAALKEVATIHERAVAQAQAARSAPPPSRLPGRAEDAARRTLRIAPAVAPFEARRAPARDPEDSAVAYLLHAQRADGHFAPFLAPTDAETTAFCVLALLDAAEDGDEEPLSAARRGAQAIAALAADAADTPLDADPALLGWALAAAYARLGDAGWPEPLRLLLARLEEGPSGKDRPGALRALWRLVLLHEVDPLAVAVPDRALLARLYGAVTEDAAGMPPVTDPAVAYARDLLRLEADLPEDGPGARTSAGEFVVDGHRPLGAWIRGPGTIHDPLALLLGTVYLRARFGTDDLREGTTWWNRVLVRAVDRQVREGPEAGSWDPGDARSRVKGRVWTTAVTLLAWRAWDVPWREPVAR